MKDFTTWAPKAGNRMVLTMAARPPSTMPVVVAGGGKELLAVFSLVEGDIGVWSMPVVEGVLIGLVGLVGLVGWLG